MNIKLKAFLITLSIIFGFFGSVYTAIHYPIVPLIVFLVGLVYAMYKLVLDWLERKLPR